MFQIRLQTFGADKPSSATDVITLKIKSEDGNHTYILKMSSSETIGDLRQHLDKHRWERIHHLTLQQFPSVRNVTVCLCFSRITEGSISMVMTSSVCTHSAVTMKTATRSSHVGSQLMLLCCCVTGNILIRLKSWNKPARFSCVAWGRFLFFTKRNLWKCILVNLLFTKRMHLKEILPSWISDSSPSVMLAMKKDPPRS